MDYRTAFPSKYLKAEDLGGARVVVEIADVRVVEIGADRRLCASFIDRGKALPLNRVNATTIAELAGSPDTDHWRGLRVTLFATPVMFQGRTVSAVRVGPAPGAARPADSFGDVALGEIDPEIGF